MNRRLSRRAFLGGAAAVAASSAAGATYLATRGGGAPASESSPATATLGPAPSSTPVPTLSPRAQGSQTIVSPGAHSFDTFDAQLTGESAVVEILGRTHSRLLNWMPGGTELKGDLSTAWEQPDPTTVIFHLDSKARWHNRAPLNGRELTGWDVVSHFQRVPSLSVVAPKAQRLFEYAAIESVDRPSVGQVRFRLNQPDEFLLDTLAGEFALIQAPEAVEAFADRWPKLDSDHVIGTGPWTFDWIESGLGFTAFTEGHRQPLLESLRVVEPVNVAQRFIDGQLDEGITFDRRDETRVTSARDAGADGLSGLQQLRRPARELVMSSFFIGSPPWNNPQLISAISTAVNRHRVVKDLFGERAFAVGPFSPFTGGTGVTEKVLVTMPGYGPWTDSSRADSRQRWEASGGPGLGTVTVDFPSAFDPRYSSSSIVIDMLNGTLGPQFRAAVETYTTISKRVIDGYYGNARPAFWFGWGPPLPSPDGRRFAMATYAAGSPGQRSVGGPGARNPFDATEIAGSGFLGIVPWAQQSTELFRRRSALGPEPSPFWTQHLDYTRTNRA